MERYEKLYEAINTLSEDEKDLVIALYFKDMTDKEYANLIGFNQSSITRKKAKILRKLKELLDFL